MVLIENVLANEISSYIKMDRHVMKYSKDPRETLKTLLSVI